METRPVNDNARRVVDLWATADGWEVRRLDTGRVLVRSHDLPYAYDVSKRWNRAG